MTKYTPGPWKWLIEDYSLAILQGPKEEEDHVLSSSPCRACLAHIKRSTPPHEWEWARCTVPNEANARLISAAPDLLEALQAVIPQGGDWWCPICKISLDGSRVTNSECCDTCGAYLGGISEPEWILRARAAIAKALGNDCRKDAGA